METVKKILFVLVVVAAARAAKEMLFAVPSGGYTGANPEPTIKKYLP